jgi:hypothetical protein
MSGGSSPVTPSSTDRRRDVAKRVEVRDLSERAVVKLATERKHLTDIDILFLVKRSGSWTLSPAQSSPSRRDDDARGQNAGAPHPGQPHGCGAEHAGGRQPQGGELPLQYAPKDGSVFVGFARGIFLDPLLGRTVVKLAAEAMKEAQ